MYVNRAFGRLRGDIRERVENVALETHRIKPSAELWVEVLTNFTYKDILLSFVLQTRGIING